MSLQLCMTFFRYIAKPETNCKTLHIVKKFYHNMQWWFLALLNPLEKFEKSFFAQTWPFLFKIYKQKVQSYSVLQ